MKKLILSSAPMTNSEYFEKNNVPFAKALEIFNKQKRFTSFDKFLAAEYVELKFKVGDLIVLQLNEEPIELGWKHNVVFEVIDIVSAASFYKVRFLTPNNPEVSPVGTVREVTVGFIDRNCILY